MLRVVLGFCVLIFIGALAIIASLARGPVSIDFAGPYISQVLEAQYPELKLDFGELGLEWNGNDKNLVVAVDNLTILKSSQRIASIPDVSVTFSGEALLRGKIAPKELEFTGMKLRMTRSKEGDIQLGYEYALLREKSLLAPGPSDEQVFDAESQDAIVALLEELSGEPNKDQITGYLTRVELLNSTVFMEDETMGTFWQGRNVDVFLWRENDTLFGQASGGLKLGNETVTFIAFANYDRQQQVTMIDGNINDLPLNLLADQAPELALLAGAQLEVSGHFDVSLDKDFIPGDIGFDLKSGAGEIDLPELYKQPFSLTEASVSGSIDSGFEKVTFDKAVLLTLGSTVNATGSASFGDEGFGLVVNGELTNFQVNNLDRYWPYSMAVDGYDWVISRIREGRVPAAEFAINLPAGALDSGNIPSGAVKLSFNMEGVTTNYFPPLPKVTDIKGRAVLTETGISITDLTGKLGSLDVTSDKVRIYDFDKYDQLADINVHVTGSSREIFIFLDREPLGFATPYGVVPDAMKGTGDVKASFKFPLRDDLVLEKVDYKAEGQFKDAFIPDVGGGIDLTDGDLGVKVDPKGIDIIGTAELDKVPFNLEAQSWFTGSKEGYRVYDISGAIDDAARKTLGLESDIVEGPIDLTASIETRPDGYVSGRVAADVTQTMLDVEMLHWSKEAGTAGKITAEFDQPRENITRLKNINITAGDLTATGEANLEGSEVTTATVPGIRYGENDFSVEYTQNADKRININVAGKQFDLKPFVVATYDLNEADVEGGFEDRLIDIEVNIEKLLMDQNVVLSDAWARFEIEEELIKSSKMKARISEGKHVNYEIRPQEGGRQVTFVTNDAGSLLAGLDLYDNLRNGELNLTAVIDDTKAERPASGNISMKDVLIVNAPVLAKILTVGSLGGIVDLLRGEGVTFATVEGPFTYENGIITTKDFRAVGSIGITMTGTVDQPANKIDAFGTVIPSYTLNSMLGNIPILGPLLVGKKGEGIFGFSYKVTGGLDDPQTSVNPLSALAPGILRRMFFEPWDQDDVQPPDPYANKGEEPGN